MKVVQVANIAHHVYEGRNEFNEHHIGVELKRTYRETNEGDWVESSTGFIMQCLKRRLHILKRNKSGKVANSYEKHRFVFPKLQKFIYNKQLDDQPYYFPTSNRNIVMDDPELGRTIRTPKVKLFAQGVREGLPIDLAYQFAFGNRDRGKASFLLQLRDVAYFIFNDNPRIENMRQELESIGVTKNSIAEKIKSILDDPKPNPQLLKWALETSMTVLEDERVQEHQNAVLVASQHFIQLPNRIQSLPLLANGSHVLEDTDSQVLEDE